MTDTKMNIFEISLNSLFNKVAKRFTLETVNEGIFKFEPVNIPSHGLTEKPESISAYVRINGFCVGKQQFTSADEVYNKMVVLKDMKIYDDSELTVPDDSYWKLGYGIYWYKNGAWFEIGRNNYYDICECQRSAANHADFISSLEKIVERHLSYSEYRHIDISEQSLLRVIPVADEPINLSRRARIRDKFRKGIIPMIGKGTGLGMEIIGCGSDEIKYKVYHRLEDSSWEYTGYDGLISGSPNFFGRRFIGEDLVKYDGRPYDIDIIKTAVIICDNKPCQISFDEGSKLIYDAAIGDFRKMNDSDYIKFIAETPYTAKFIPYTGR